MPFRPRPADLPDFGEPPVSELVLSIQYGGINGFNNAYGGLFWGEVRDQYSIVSERPAQGAVFETFGGAPQQPMVQFEAFFTPPASRFWFEETEGEHLLQLQSDRIVHNWRRQTGSQISERKYPRYEAIRDMFESEVDKLQKFTAREGLGEVKPNQVELSYINFIKAPSAAGKSHSKLALVTPFVNEADGETLGRMGLELENSTLQSRFIIQDEGGTPCGRVYVSYVPVFRSTDYCPGLQLEITVRMRPLTDSIDAAFDRLDDARDLGVRTFDLMTTTEMHEVWRKK